MTSVLCPICDRSIGGWSARAVGEDGDPCEHLLADWGEEPDDNGGGVLGEMLDPSEGIGGAEDLADLSRELCASVWSPDDNDEIVARATAEARLSLAATAVAGEKPTWWAALQEAVLGGYDPDASPDDRMTIAQFANPMALAVAENLPGLIVTYETLGGPMTSGTFIYIWSDDPLEGRATIDAAFASAISTVEMMIATLDS